jgi:prephenate dehydrogenase
VVADEADRAAEARRAGARWAALDDVARCRWVVAAVPIGRLRAALAELAARMGPGQVLVDVCSVKELPAGWLREAAPPGVSVVATHPLFGPDSAARSLVGLPLVICPAVRAAACARSSGGSGDAVHDDAAAAGDHDAARRLAAYARSRGLRVLTLDASEHDRAMARTQALTFFLSRVLSRLDLPQPEGPVGTRSYRNLRAALESVARDTDELYRDLVRFNPHARRFLEEVARAMGAEADALGLGDEARVARDVVRSGAPRQRAAY